MLGRTGLEHNIPAPRFRNAHLFDKGFVNIDHVATLRQARGTTYPRPAEAAHIAERAGADSITVHLREDRRHIQDRDVRILRETIKTKMNLELANVPEMVEIALEAIKIDVART